MMMKKLRNVARVTKSRVFVAIRVVFTVVVLNGKSVATPSAVPFPARKRNASFSRYSVAKIFSFI